MPVNVRVDRSQKLVVTTYSGHVTDKDVAHQIAQVERNAPYDGDYRAITDFTNVTQFEISSDQIRLVAESKSPLENARRVIVAPTDVAYGTSRMFQMLSGKTRPNITVVRTLSEAYEALGIDTKAS